MPVPPGYGASPLPIGRRFGRLVLLNQVGVRAGSKRRVRCRCDCGAVVVRFWGNVHRGLTRSCGCLQRELAGQRNATHGETRRTRGRRRTPEYIAWMNIGARGVRVDPEWLSSFAAFLAAVGRRPSPRHSIDRIDVNGDYAPGNVRWATPLQQARNRRNTIWVDYHGERVLLVELAAQHHIRPSALLTRLGSGWPIDRALTEPVRKRAH